jgi:butyrate kinase
LKNPAVYYKLYILMKKHILAINPGSTSTKVALFEREKKIKDKIVSHDLTDLVPFEKIIDQQEFRTKVVLDFLSESRFNISDLDAVVGRGGLLTPMESGTYLVTKKMIDYLSNTMLEHASNLGAIIAYKIARKSKSKAYIVDPVVVDEMDDIARITGIPEIKRISIFHALNQKAAARRAAHLIGKNYQNCQLIVAHLGGGISVGAHSHGRVIDVNNGLNGDGPFTPERAGTIPTWSLIELATSYKYTLGQLKKMVTGRGGLVAHLNTNDLRNVIEMVKKKDQKALLVYQAMAYTISKEIASLSAVLKGKIDAIVLTGGLAYNTEFINLIKDRVDFLAPVILLPGEDEMTSLALGVLRVLNGEEKEKIWKIR